MFAEGQTTTLSNRETLLGDIKSRVAHLQDRVGNVTGRLATCANLTFGEVPESPGSSGRVREARSGAAGDVIDALEYLSEQVGYLEAHAARFDAIA